MDYDLFAVVWPTPENYARFREVCGEDVPDTYAEFIIMASQRFRDLGVDTRKVERVLVDPDEMLDWCLARHGKIDTETRALFAMFKWRSKNGKGADAIN